MSFERSRSDGGAHWAVTGRGLPGVPVRAIAIDPRSASTIYAGTTGAGMYKSFDAGAHWVPVNGDLGDATQGDVNSIAVDPGTPTSLYAATSSGLFKSRNAGANWAAIGTGAIVPDVSVVAIDPSTPETIYAGSFGFPSLFRSADHGATWSLNLLGRGYGIAKWSRQSPSALLIDPRASSRLYVALGSDVLLKSVDYGTTWQRMVLPAEGAATLASEPTSFDTLYAASKRLDSFAIAASHSATLYVSSAEGLQRSDDGSTTTGAAARLITATRRTSRCVRR